VTTINYTMASATVNFSEVGGIAGKRIWGYLTSPESKALKVVKVIVGSPLFIILAAAAITSTFLACIVHIAAIPMALDKNFNLKSFNNYYKSSVKEVMAVFFAIIMFPIDLTALNPQKSQSKKIPIVLVHGYFHNSSAWFYQREKLKQHIDADVYTINLKNVWGTIEQHAQHLQKEIRKIEVATGRSDVFLVGHSMGGYVISFYATNLAKKNTVKTAVTIASPLEGTTIARAAVGKSGREMEFNSESSKKLNHSIRKSKIPFVHMGSVTDLMIRPMKSTMPVHSNATYVEYDCGHTTFLQSHKVTDTIVGAYRRMSAGG
jgi:predicted alpha/beta hydrolase family esterase